MTSIQGLLAYHEDICANARRLVEERGNEYANPEDTLSTFKLVGNITGEPASKAAWLLMSVKVARLKEAINKEKFIDDTIYDLINYAVYLMDLYHGEHEF